MSNSCNATNGSTLIFACSGAADVGEVADQAARKLTRDGVGSMFCLAGIGGNVPGILKTTQDASNILAIDGCSVNCVKHCLEQAGFTQFKHLLLADIGMDKGKTPLTAKTIAQAAQAAQVLLQCESC